MPGARPRCWHGPQRTSPRARAAVTISASCRRSGAGVELGRSGAGAGSPRRSGAVTGAGPQWRRRSSTPRATEGAAAMQLLETLRAQFAETTDAVRRSTDEIAANPDGLAVRRAGREPRHAERAAGSAGAAHRAGAGARRPYERRRRTARRRAERRRRARPGSRRERRAAPTSRRGASTARALAAGDVAEPVSDAIDRLMLGAEQCAASPAGRPIAGAGRPDDREPGRHPAADVADRHRGFHRHGAAVMSAFSSRPLPASGMSITFPTVTVRAAGRQADDAKNATIASRATMIVAGHCAGRHLRRRRRRVSVQAIQRTDPSYLAIVNELYAEEMASRWTRTRARPCCHGARGGANNKTLSLALGGDDIAKVLADAGKTILRRARANFDTLVIGLDLWAHFVGAVDADGRPLFPNIGPSNPVGTAAVNSATGNARGSRSSPTRTWPRRSASRPTAARSRRCSAGVQTLRADNPAKLGVDFAVFEFAAFARAPPVGAGQVDAGA